MIGRRLGGYELVEELGRGGMAVVYRAYQPSLNRHVAVKVLPPRLSFDPQFVERFQREARAAASLRHPNIVVIHDVGQLEGTYYIVMEYLEGRTLKQLIEQEGPLPPARAASIVEQVAAALDYAHQRGFIHRDIKPANIFVGTDDHVTLTDFGIAKAAWETQHLTRTGVLIGTPEYMSPEQAEGRTADHRADLYALGVVLYQMLTGRVPFRGTTPHATLYAVVYESPPPPRQLNPKVSPVIETVVLRALAKQPGERFQTGKALSSAFHQASAGTSVRAPASAMGPRDRRVGQTPSAASAPAASVRSRSTQARPHARRLAIVVALIIVLLVSLIGWLIWPSADDTTTQRDDGGTTSQHATGTAVAAWNTSQAATATSVSKRSDDTGTSATEVAFHATESALKATVEALEAHSLTGTAEAAEREQMTRTASATSSAISSATAEAAAKATQTAQARPTVTYTSRPTLTPTQTPSPQPPTPRPTPIPPTPTRSCSMAPGWPFDAMDPAPKLGCPTSPSSSTHYSHQLFEGGQMIYRHDLRRIYVLYYVGNTWESYPDTYNEGEPWRLQEYDPPPGLQQPIKGFDRVWENNPQVRNKVGWALQGEVGLIGGNYEDFESGTALWLSHQDYLTAYFLLFSDSTWMQR